MNRWWQSAALAAAVVAMSAATACAQDASPMDARGESVFAGVDTLSLDMLEREALLRNPGFAAMRAAAAAARAQARIAGSLDDPMVGIMAAPKSFGNDRTDPAYRWNVTQKLPVFGERGLERRSATSEAAAATLDVETARLDLLEQVRNAFFELYRIARALETNAEQVGLLSQFRRVALARYASGEQGQQDALAADGELGTLAHQQVMLESDRRVAAVRLNILLQRDPALPVPPAPRTLALPALGDTARASLVSHAPWPELRAADARVAAGSFRLSLAARRRLPQLTVGFQRDFFMREPDFRSMATLGFNVPLNFGRLAAAEDQARARLAQARAQRAAMASQLAGRVETARAEYEESAHGLEVVEQILIPASERALTAARAGYEAGRGGFLDLMDAARRRADAHFKLEEARASTARGWAALRRAVAADVVSIRTVEPGAEPDGADAGRPGGSR